MRLFTRARHNAPRVCTSVLFISHCAHYLATFPIMLICLVSGGSHLRNSLWRHTLQGDACVTNSCMPRTSSVCVDVATHLYGTHISPLHKCHWYTSVSDRFTQ
ncbi:hypothetical protein GBAR_LOCUS1750 [Geodia barretti]|uniref:Uncharacterized protein n=1 Tax=Geodia barretti TaxID=519541 RepID=A0AA35QYR3_GEOBA|nr:hypothetical protein GBAR_LOCUS1750 [Geodia barretti]